MRLLTISLFTFILCCGCSGTKTDASIGLPLERSAFLTDLRYPGSTELTNSEFAQRNANQENVETAKKAGIELPDMAQRNWYFKTSDSVDKVRDFYKSKLSGALIEDAASGDTWTLDEALDGSAIYTVSINYTPPNAKKAPQAVLDNNGAASEDVDIFLTKLSEGGTYIDLHEVVLLQE